VCSECFETAPALEIIGKRGVSDRTQAAVRDPALGLLAPESAWGRASKDAPKGLRSDRENPPISP
jgi:hypothetical protein